MNLLLPLLAGGLLVALRKGRKRSLVLFDEDCQMPNISPAEAVQVSVRAAEKAIRKVGDPAPTIGPAPSDVQRVGDYLNAVATTWLLEVAAPCLVASGFPRADEWSYTSNVFHARDVRDYADAWEQAPQDIREAYYSFVMSAADELAKAGYAVPQFARQGSPSAAGVAIAERFSRRLR